MRGLNPETKFEKDITNEPETIGEFAPPQAADVTGWDSLADVPFAGDLQNDAPDFEPLSSSDI